ncbi:hypothetical protein [Kitasatospora camelliae]|uniref:Uncharacterized protein n=1 Tax=Kitasatospora camelliae TaxID=3156397 RepID=A0AAU8JW03_9ACTN
MRRRHSFHLDRDGHAVTVNVRAGYITETELLVDGRELAFHREHGQGTRPLVLTAEADRVGGRALSVRVEHPAGGGPLVCTLEIDGRSWPMPDRVPA